MRILLLTFPLTCPPAAFGQTAAASRVEWLARIPELK